MQLDLEPIKDRHLRNYDDLTIRALVALRREKPEQYRMVAYALDNPKATHAEIAEALGCSRVNVTRQLGRGIKNLEKFKQRAKTQVSS